MGKPQTGICCLPLKFGGHEGQRAAESWGGAHLGVGIEAIMAPPHAVRPERHHSLPSVAPQHIVRPERKKPAIAGFLINGV